MNIEYRPADKTDIEPILSLNKALIDEYENPEIIDYQKVLSWVQRKIETHIQDYICILLGDQKVGYYFFHRTEDKMEIDDLYIFPQYQNMGIGTEVLKKCISKTNLPIFLYVFADNKKAIALYQKFGFRVTKVIKSSRYIMQRN